MGKKMTKSRLAIILSRLEVFFEPKVRVEQYPMDSEIGAEVLWNAYYIRDIGQKVIADLGCGTGILGLGALALGAKLVYFIDIDWKALEIAKRNYNKLKSEGLIPGEAIFLCQDIDRFNEKVDTVLQNPPFGTKVRHSDKAFLEKAIDIAGAVWTFHKSETKGFVNALCRDNKAEITHEFDFEFPIKAVHDFHKRRIHRINVSCFRIKSKGI